MAFLTFRAVRLAFGGVRALDDVDLDVEAGDCVALIGPNGSGKSTLVNVLSGLYRPEAGTVTLSGRNVTGAPARAMVRAGVARTFQNPRFFSRMSVRENLEAALDAFAPWHEAVLLSSRRRHERRARIATVAEDFDLSHRLDDDIDRLSLLERRHAEIARALVVDPALLLLDEPAAGLAPAEVDLLIQRLRDGALTGRTVLLIEHKSTMVEALCSRTVVMRAGAIMAAGPTARMLADAGVRRLWMGVTA